MNNKTCQKFFITTASLGLIFAMVNASPAQAATITYDFEVSIDSGLLLNEIYSGFFSFDNSTLSGVGEEYLSVSDLEFNFLGFDYTEADDSSFFGSEVAFFDGDFLGLSFSTDTSFSFIPGFFAVDEAYFAYDVTNVGAGAGNITYSLRASQPSKSTPEPTSLITLLGLGTLAVGSQLKRKQLQKN
jgi:hypothetical protein